MAVLLDWKKNEQGIFGCRFRRALGAETGRHPMLPTLEGLRHLTLPAGRLHIDGRLRRQQSISNVLRSAALVLATARALIPVFPSV